MRILFVHNYPSKFVQIDLDLLRERFEVREWYQRSRAIDFYALARAVQRCDLVFGWFASWHTLFPITLARWFNRRSVVVVGGYDTANLPEISYGSQRGGIKRRVTRATMRSASRLVVNSRYTCQEVLANDRLDAEKISMIYHGFPVEAASPRPKENLVITVGNVDRGNLQRKGLELFVRAAVECPEKDFVMIGAWRDDAIRQLQALAPTNVKFTGWVSDGELRDYFARAQVYVQVSRHEGFGLAVAEAMLHECTPVVTCVGALPEVVGDAGVFVESFEPSAVAAGVRLAFAQADAIGPRARARIVQEFPLERRRAQLFQLLENLAGGHR